MKVLALDHGAARTGVAVSDPTGTIVRPLAAIRRVDSPVGRAELERVIAEEAPERIVVGDPRGLSGARGTQSHAAHGFAARLRARVSAPVDLLDERLTTVEARRRLAGAAVSSPRPSSSAHPSRPAGGRRGAPTRAGRGPDLDSVAACVLLEAYLAGAR